METSYQGVLDHNLINIHEMHLEFDYSNSKQLT